MTKFKIEQREGDTYITNLEHNFTLKVIPPEKQPEGYELGRQVVGADFVSFSDRVVHGIDTPGYDFESLDDAYFDDDSEHCNKEIWYETIACFCRCVLDREPEGYTAYNYDYDLGEDNCSPECWAALNSGTGGLATKILALADKKIGIIPGFDRLEKAMEDGLLIYRLFNANHADSSNFELGRMLFDLEENWVYEGKILNTAEQQQVAACILTD